MGLVMRCAVASPVTLVFPVGPTSGTDREIAVIDAVRSMSSYAYAAIWLGYPFASKLPALSRTVLPALSVPPAKNNKPGRAIKSSLKSGNHPQHLLNTHPRVPPARPTNSTCCKRIPVLCSHRMYTYTYTRSLRHFQTCCYFTKRTTHAPLPSPHHTPSHTTSAISPNPHAHTHPWQCTQSVKDTLATPT
jgi:hypothetical protein